MALLVLLSAAQLINTIESSSCSPKEFTDTPIEVENSCDTTENLENRWRGELSYTRTETHTEVHWKKIVQDWECVKAMEFFMDSVKQQDIWGDHKESVWIEKSGEFSLKVEVYFVGGRKFGSSCYGIPGRECKCFEATKNLNIHGDNEGNASDGIDGQNNTDSAFRVTVEISPAAAASGGAIFFLALLLTLAICIFKHRRKEERRRLEKAEEEEMVANTDESNVYGIYATSNEETDDSYVIDTNPHYE